MVSPWPSPLRAKQLRPALRHGKLPPGLFQFVWQLSAADQVWIAALSIAVALLDTIPIEVQRRIVDDLTKGHDFEPILLLTFAYAGLVACQGLAKLLLNLYRSWVAEHSVRSLRSFISEGGPERNADGDEAKTRGVEISMIVAESDPVGTFVGASISEPLLQIGILVSVFGYLTYLRPLLALITLCVISPQFVFVPLIQRSINRKVERRISTLRGASAGTLEGQQDDQGLRHQEARFAQIFQFNMSIFRLKFSLNFLMNLTHHLGIAIVLGVGGWMVVNGRAEIGTIVAFISGLSTVRDPWGDLVLWFQNLMVTETKYRLIVGATEVLPASRRRAGGA